MSSPDLVAHLRRARDHIDRHSDQPLDLDRLAAVAGACKHHFAPSFTATYRTTPIRYLIRRRIERAQDLLRHANLSVTEVCTAVGFASLGSFSSRFTARTGETPTVLDPAGTAQPGRSIPEGRSPTVVP